MTTHFAGVNGTRIAWDEAGSGPPVVLVHAGIADRRMWRGQMSALAANHRVIQFDQRSFGETPVGTGPFSRVNDLVGFLDHLGLDTAILVGCSMGGGMLLDLAVAQPERVEAMVISNSTARGFVYEDDTPPGIAAAFEEAEAAGDLDPINELEVQYWVDGIGRTAADVNPEVRELVREMNGIALGNEDTGSEELPGPSDTFHRLGEITIPTLVIVGEYDRPRTIAGCREIADRIPGARHEVIANTAHLPALERPDEFNRLVLGFLEELEP